MNYQTNQHLHLFLELRKILEILDIFQSKRGMPFWLLGRQHQVGRICHVEVKFIFVLLLIETKDDKSYDDSEAQKN